MCARALTERRMHAHAREREGGARGGNRGASPAALQRGNGAGGHQTALGRQRRRRALVCEHLTGARVRARQASVHAPQARGSDGQKRGDAWHSERTRARARAHPSLAAAADDQRSRVQLFRFGAHLQMRTCSAARCDAMRCVSTGGEGERSWKETEKASVAAHRVRDGLPGVFHHQVRHIGALTRQAVVHSQRSARSKA
jgi:hypothetical protein